MTSYTDTILPPREGRGLPHWGIAALVVLAMHLAIGAFVILTRRSDMPPGAPTDTVMIDLAPVAAAPSQPQELTTPTPQEEPKPTPPPPEPDPPLQTVPETPPVMAAPPPPEQPVPTILQTPELPPAPKAEAVLPSPKPVPDKRLKQNRVEKQKRIDQERQRKERAERLRKDHARAAASARAAARRAAGPAPGAARQSMSSWVSQVQARINAAKRYPEAARARGESGTATLAFTVDAGGRIVSAQIASSAGSSALDNATLSMAHRLGHLPPPPNGRVTLRVRVSFSVR